MRYCPFCGCSVAAPRARICDRPRCRRLLNKIGMQTALRIPDGYLTTAGYARLRELTTQTVNKRCRAGEIKGAIQDEQSGRWFIPAHEAMQTNETTSTIERRVIRHKLKTTQAEYDEIVDRADRLGLSVNEYLIRCAIRDTDFEGSFCLK